MISGIITSLKLIKYLYFIDRSPYIFYMGGVGLF